MQVFWKYLIKSGVLTFVSGLFSIATFYLFNIDSQWYLSTLILTIGTYLEAWKALYKAGEK